MEPINGFYEVRRLMVLKIDEDEGKQPDMKKDDERIEKATIILIDAIDSIHGSVLPSQKIVWKIDLEESFQERYELY